jgi:outer membrane lipoprotein-sorting protein
MTLSSDLTVLIERPIQALAATMGDMRTWLDTHKVQPASFKIAPTEGSVAFQVRFREQNHASLFQRQFTRG